MTIPIPHVLLAPDGTAINRVLLAVDSDWQPPAGHQCVPDPDGSIWAKATKHATEDQSPRWIDFSSAIMADTEVNAMLAILLQSAPGLYGGLIAGLQEASKGDDRLFLDAWSKAVGIGVITPGLVFDVQELARQWHLPSDFIAALGQ